MQMFAFMLFNSYNDKKSFQIYIFFVEKDAFFLIKV